MNQIKQFLNTYLFDMADDEKEKFVENFKKVIYGFVYEHDDICIGCDDTLLPRMADYLIDNKAFDILRSLSKTIKEETDKAITFRYQLVVEFLDGSTILHTDIKPSNDLNELLQAIRDTQEFDGKGAYPYGHKSLNFTIYDEQSKNVYYNDTLKEMLGPCFCVKVVYKDNNNVEKELFCKICTDYEDARQTYSKKVIQYEDRKLYEGWHRKTEDINHKYPNQEEKITFWIVNSDMVTLDVTLTEL